MLTIYVGVSGYKDNWKAEKMLRDGHWQWHEGIKGHRDLSIDNDVHVYSYVITKWGGEGANTIYGHNTNISWFNFDLSTKSYGIILVKICEEEERKGNGGGRRKEEEEEKEKGDRGEWVGDHIIMY